MINQADQLGGKIDQIRRKKGQPNINELSAKAPSEARSRTQRGTAKAVRTVHVSQTVEFVETRAAKVSGQRAAFEGRVFSDSQQEMYLLYKNQDVKDQEDNKDREEQGNRLKKLQQLNKKIEGYSVDTFRNQLLTDVEETKETTTYMGRANYRQLEEVLDLIRQMTNQHNDSLDQPTAQIIEGCFREYANHLDDLERTDIASLKRRIGEMRGMKKNLANDLEGCDMHKTALLKEREQVLKMQDESQSRRGDDRIRQMINATSQRLLQHKQQLDAIVAHDQDKLRELAEELKYGKDDLYNDNATTVETLY